MRGHTAVGMALMVVLAPGAMAKERPAYQAIAAGDLAEAEQTLNADRAIYRDRPEVMLNLAAIYVRTGRIMQARALYGDVLSRDQVAMEMPDGLVRSSHDVARSGLALAGATIAAR